MVAARNARPEWPENRDGDGVRAFLDDVCARLVQGDAQALLGIPSPLAWDARREAFESATRAGGVSVRAIERDGEVIAYAAAVSDARGFVDALFRDLDAPEMLLAALRDAPEAVTPSDVDAVISSEPDAALARLFFDEGLLTDDGV